MKKIRIGILGCANIAKRSVVPALQQLPKLFEIKAVASRDIHKAQTFADFFNIEAIEGYDTLLQREDIDALYMPLPTGLHEEWVYKCLMYGKHVYAEKSFAMHADEARKNTNIAREKNLALMEGYMFLYHPQHQRIKDIVAKGQIGEIREFRARFGFPPFPDANNFRYDPIVGGGALKDAAGYVLRALRLYFDKIKLKDACIHYDQKGCSVYGSAYFNVNADVSASIAFGFDNFYQCNYELWGSKGKITACKAFTPKADEDVQIILETQNNREDIICPAHNHFVSAMQHFYELCNSDISVKEKEYQDIVTQSEFLDKMENLTKIK